MDHSHPNPVPKIQATRVAPVEQPEVSPPEPTIESLFPTADANELLELITQGHSPDDLHKLINRSKKVV